MTKQFVLGEGTDGVAGGVRLTLTVLSTPKEVRVRWLAGKVDQHLRERAVAFTQSFLTSHVIAHPEFGLSATIDELTVDPVRQNDPERVINLALRDAIELLSLSPIPFYAPPEMSIPVQAPRLAQSECRSEEERRFLEHLNQRAKTGGWQADAWSHTTDHVLLAISYATYRDRDLRIDYFGDRLLLGGDETGQFVTDQNPSDPDVTVVSSGTPEELADAPADWIEVQLKSRRVWGGPDIGWTERYQTYRGSPWSS